MYSLSIKLSIRFFTSLASAGHLTCFIVSLISSVCLKVLRVFMILMMHASVTATRRKTNGDG